MKKNGAISVKNEKLFERSEFFSFRRLFHFLALEREPALFLFVSFSFVRTKEKRKPLQNGRTKPQRTFSFCYLFLSDARKKK